MPDRELASPRGSRGRARTVADLLKPGLSGVAKTLASPRNMRASLVSPLVSLSPKVHPLRCPGYISEKSLHHSAIPTSWISTQHLSKEWECVPTAERLIIFYVLVQEMPRGELLAEAFMSAMN